MGLDYDRGKEKESEILDSVSEFFYQNGISKDMSENMSKLIFNNAIKVTPPEKEEHFMEMMIVNRSGRGGGKSIKAGNIKLNIKKLFEAVANGAFAITGAVQVPILTPMAFLILWNSLWKTIEVPITENDAAVIWAMWVYRDREKNEISNTGLLDIVNKHLMKYERSLITQNDLNYSLDNLTRIKSIKRSKSNANNWWLCEWIKPKYR